MLFSSSSKAKLSLLLDIQSSIIRGALVRTTSPSAPPEIIFTHSVELPFKPQVGSGYLIKVATKAISEVVETTLQQLSQAHSADERIQGTIPKKISTVHYILSSPWMVSQAKTLSVTLPSEVKITREKITEMTVEERNRLLGHDAAELSVVEEKVFDVRLNGYSVPSWEGRMADKLDVSFVIGIASTRMIKKFRELCHQMASDNHIYFHSSLLLQNVGIQKILPHQSSYTLLHVHGELTDIVVVNRYSCVFFGSYPQGTHSIVRKIARASKTDVAAAESLLSLYSENHLDAAHKDDAEKIIADISNDWIAEFEKLFRHACVASALPGEVLLSSRKYEPFFTGIFKKTYPQSKVSLLTVEQLRPHVTFAGHAEPLRILGLCASAIHSMGY